ncbi:MAG: hypothetical protein L0387_33505 [Acidobacteria bacterium]|nr:hypothetical protein [Acidobacteriota bacterium]MCI0721941.1 hypothetical protein [Acidobacteriota bacterium]
MEPFGTENQVKWLRSVLTHLLFARFSGLVVGHIVPSSLERQEQAYEVEIVSIRDGRTSWFHVTHGQLELAAAGDSSHLLESLKKLIESAGFRP